MLSSAAPAISLLPNTASVESDAEPVACGAPGPDFANLLAGLNPSVANSKTAPANLVAVVTEGKTNPAPELSQPSFLAFSVNMPACIAATTADLDEAPDKADVTPPSEKEDSSDKSTGDLNLMPLPLFPLPAVPIQFEREPMQEDAVEPGFDPNSSHVAECPSETIAGSSPIKISDGNPMEKSREPAASNSPRYQTTPQASPSQTVTEAERDPLNERAPSVSPDPLVIVPPPPSDVNDPAKKSMAVPAPMVAAQFAARWTEPVSPTGDALSEENKNRAQTPDKKAEAKPKTEAGIDHANTDTRMFVLTPSLTSAAPLSPPAEPARLLSDAARMVERVTHAAESVAAGNPDEKIQLRIELPDMSVVDVRVALRDGQVHAVFRSDSPEMRDALASAWDNFSTGREASGHAWAEPVFTRSEPAAVAPTPAAATTQGFNQDSGQSSSSREQPPARDGQSVYFPVRPGFFHGSTPSADAALSGMASVDSSRLLHVLA